MTALTLQRGETALASVSGTPIWLSLEPDPVYAVLHTPERSNRRECAVLILPPFGWEELCSYRSRRTWAIELAKAGFCAARLDLPGSGDSVGGPRDGGRFQTWVDAVTGTASWLRASTGATRVVAVGIGLGGLLAYKAISAGAAIDDLILWAVPARGRTYLRELRAYAAAVASGLSDDPSGPPSTDGTVEVTGFAISAETAAALEALALDQLELPRPGDRHVLLIERDGLGVDKRLHAHLAQQGANVSVLHARDYAALMAHPGDGRTPHESIERSIRWLCEVEPSGSPPVPPRSSGIASGSITFDCEGRPIRETMIGFDGDHGRVVGIISEPVAAGRASLCAVFVNPGALRRTGPNRMWVELARRWAADGVPVVRLDVPGLGDSDGDESQYVDVGNMYLPRMTEDLIDLLGRLEAEGIADRFLLAGLCSGAYWSLKASLVDRRVAGAFLLNLFAFQWTRQLVAERDQRRAVRAVRQGLLQRVRRGVSRDQVARALRSLRSSLKPGGRSAELSQASLIDDALDTLRDNRTQVLMLLSTGEPLYEQLDSLGKLARLGQWPNLRVEQIPTRDHDLRALWIQRLVETRLDAALEDLLSGRGDQR